MLKTAAIKDEFGFLLEKYSFSLDEIEITPLSNYDELKNYVDEHTNTDSYYYPPLMYKAKIDPKTCKPLEEIPRTKRPAHLYKLPPSHIIIVKNAEQKIEKLRNGATGFLIHLLGYLFGCRVQFSNWWVDNRISMKSQHGVFIPEKEANDFLRHSFKEWETWSPNKQFLFTDLLFMHTRVSGYEWDWERFMMEYIVFDGCWKFYADGMNFRISHGDRLKKILTDFRMVVHCDKIKKIVDLRNGLFHEARWEGKQPGSHTSNDAFYAYYWLKSINQRLFPALLNYQTKYITSDWACMGQFLFKI